MCEFSAVNIVANGLVNPRRMVASAHNAEQTRIKGRRLPNRDLELSARIPGEHGQNLVSS